MNYDSFSTEDLKNRVDCLNVAISFTTDRINNITKILDEDKDERYKIQEIIDRREINQLVDASLEEQVKYFLSTFDDEKTQYYISKRIKVFNCLGLIVTCDKIATWEGYIDFINKNREEIKIFLPLVLKFTKQKYVMESIPYHTIKVLGNKMIDRINYYPLTDEYYTDGVYIRNFKTLDSLLDHMLEE